VFAAKFDASRFAGEFGMRCGHLAVEEERNVGVEFFLELMQPLIGAIPRPRLMHGEEDFIGLLIESEKIDDGRVGYARLVLVLVLMPVPALAPMLVIVIAIPHRQRTSNNLP
jgi:hypothetical protein